MHERTNTTCRRGALRDMRRKSYTDVGTIRLQRMPSQTAGSFLQDPLFGSGPFRRSQCSLGDGPGGIPMVWDGSL